MPTFSYEKHFPFDTIRDQQRDAIEFALDAFLNQKKKYVILEMGTGCGKSPTGLCIARALDEHLNAQEGFTRGAWFLTTQKVLQEQYMRDFGFGTCAMRTIKSSANYTCQMFDYSKHQMSCAEIVRLKKAHKFFKNMYRMCDQSCRYREEKSDFIQALDSLTNYPYFFAESQYRGEIEPRNLLVLDEAHTIEEQLGKYVEVSISERFAKEKLKKRMPAIKNINEALTWIKRHYRAALKKELDEVKNLLNDHSEALDKKVGSLTDYAKQVEILDKHLCKVNRFVKEFDANNWAMNIVEPRGRSLRKLVFKPVDVSKFSHQHLFNLGKHVLMMSATILDKGVFCRQIGINPNDVEFMRIPSPFPVENRPVHVMPVGSMSKACIDKTLPLMVEAVKLLLQQHPDEKGIIHCVNYRVANYLYENVASTRLLIHDVSNRDDVVNYHCECDEPTVLLSPSMMEGVDLRDDRSRFQIMCKTPFPYLGDEVVKKRMAKDANWYNYQTVRSVIQAMGRSIRNVDDHAVSYILDGDWDRFYKRTKRMFPAEFSDAIQ